MAGSTPVGEVQTYRVARRMRVFVPVVFVFIACAGVGVLVGTLREGNLAGVVFVSVWFALAGAKAWWALMRMPWRIDLSDEGMRFVARSRQVIVPWPSLRSVRSPWFDLNRQTIVWAWEGGRLRTPGQWDGQHQLLTAVAARAPQADIQGL